MIQSTPADMRLSNPGRPADMRLSNPRGPADMTLSDLGGPLYQAFRFNFGRPPHRRYQHDGPDKKRV